MFKEIMIASGNSGKVREIQEIFAGSGITFSSLRDHWNPVPEIPETGKTFLENARMKAEWVFSRKGIWTLADDSGLEVDALNGEPGVYSARYAGEHASDKDNIRKLLDNLAGIDPLKRTARFKCAMVLLGPDVEYRAEGVCEGRIIFQPEGESGFGYDPLFIPNGFDKTFAQLGSVDKHAISHRGKAIAKLKRIFDNLNGELSEVTKSRDRYRFLYQHIPEMCVSVDKNNLVMDCNFVFTKLLKISEQEVIGRPFPGFFAASEQHALISFLNSVRGNNYLSAGSVFRMICNNDGETSIAVKLNVVFTGPLDGVPCAVVVMQDITQSLKHEEKQNTARRQLYRSAHLVSIGTLASGVAHELNNPLAAVLGFSDALLHRLEGAEELNLDEMEQYLQIIKKETLRCRDIIDNLLKFSRDREPAIRDISLLDCIQSACMLISGRAGKKRIRIVNQITEDVIIKADPQRMGQVFLHILSNAVDFSNENSTVDITRKPSSETGRYITVQISDHGCGIASEVLPYIFDPFFTTKKVGQGAGIGLSLCHKAMEECEGLIDVISSDGKGTTVVLDIPSGTV